MDIIAASRLQMVTCVAIEILRGIWREESMEAMIEHYRMSRVLLERCIDTLFVFAVNIWWLICHKRTGACYCIRYGVVALSSAVMRLACKWIGIIRPDRARSDLSLSCRRTWLFILLALKSFEMLLAKPPILQIYFKLTIAHGAYNYYVTATRSVY
jgi:hypothetical protein